MKFWVALRESLAFPTRFLSHINRENRRRASVSILEQVEKRDQARTLHSQQFVCSFASDSGPRESKPYRKSAQKRLLYPQKGTENPQKAHNHIMEAAPPVSNSNMSSSSSSTNKRGASWRKLLLHRSSSSPKNNTSRRRRSVPQDLSLIHI